MRFGGVLLFWILLGSTFYLTPGGMYSFPTWPGSYDGTSDLTFATIITGAFGTDDSLNNLLPQGEPPGILYFFIKSLWDKVPNLTKRSARYLRNNSINRLLVFLKPTIWTLTYSAQKTPSETKPTWKTSDRIGEKLGCCFLLGNERPMMMLQKRGL